VLSGPFWRPDSEAFYALIRRGFGAYRDPEPGLCLTRVTVAAEPKKRRSTPLWCKALDRKGDAHRTFRFRMDPQARTGVLLSQPLEARSKGCAFDVRWIRLSDGKILARLRGVPLPDIGLLAHATVLGSGGLLVTPACGGGVLLVDLRHGRVHHRLRGRRFFDQRWDGERSLVMLEHVGRRRYRMVELDPRRLLAGAPAPR
jgi:hypothetical protein